MRSEDEFIIITPHPTNIRLVSPTFHRLNFMFLKVSDIDISIIIHYQSKNKLNYIIVYKTFAKLNLLFFEFFMKQGRLQESF
jgi:hypothetical protein